MLKYLYFQYGIYLFLLLFCFLTFMAVHMFLEVLEPTITGRKRELEEYLFPGGLTLFAFGAVLGILGVIAKNGYVAFAAFPLFGIGLLAIYCALFFVSIYLGLGSSLVAVVVGWKEFHPRKKSRSKAYLANLLK